MSPTLALVLALNLTQPAGLPAMLGTSEDQLAGTLRGLLLQNLPNPLYEKNKDWGKTKEITVVRFRGGQLITKRVAKNDGLWRKLRVDALNPRDTLVLDLRDVATTELGTIAFTVHLAADVRLDATQEQWENGLRLYSTSVRARARVQATLKCEASAKPEFAANGPELVCKLKVIHADVAYDNLVVEHIAGVGGEAAKMLGSAGHDLLNQWKPSIERDLLKKADEAIVKAGEKKEVRLGLGRLFKIKK